MRKTGLCNAKSYCGLTEEHLKTLYAGILFPEKVQYSLDLRKMQVDMSASPTVDLQKK